jgi:hypothetical protein
MKRWIAFELRRCVWDVGIVTEMYIMSNKA